MSYNNYNIIISQRGLYKQQGNSKALKSDTHKKKIKAYENPDRLVENKSHGKVRMSAIWGPTICTSFSNWCSVIRGSFSAPVSRTAAAVLSSTKEMDTSQ